MTPIQIPYNFIFITGAGSGIGRSLALHFDETGTRYWSPSRYEIDLDIPELVKNYSIPGNIDCLINCAAHDINGKQPLVQHDSDSIIDIVNCNLIAPLLLSKKALERNPKCCIVNITSNNNIDYPGHDLAYSLTKRALTALGDLIRIDYPDARVLEICLGLTRTDFNQNRFRLRPELAKPDFYNQPCLEPSEAAKQILEALADTGCTYKHVIKK
jgi:short-subunit dehydrogenase